MGGSDAHWWSVEISAWHKVLIPVYGQQNNTVQHVQAAPLKVCNLWFIHENWQKDPEVMNGQTLLIFYVDWDDDVWWSIHE